MKTKTSETIKFITTTAVIAALYAVLTIACTPFAYGAIQFRVSEIMVLLCFWNKKHSVGYVALGEVVILVAGYILYFILRKRHYFYRLVDATQNINFKW